MRQRLRPIIAALLVCGAATLLTASALAAGSTAPAAIQVLSNRADLISGGDALVAVQLPGGVSPKDVEMTLGSRNVTHQFAMRPNGLYEGLLTGLANGSNTLSAVIPGHDTASETIVNHPIGRAGSCRSAAQAVGLPERLERSAVQRADDVRLRVQVLGHRRI
jgi:hypothetical protein